MWDPVAAQEDPAIVEPAVFWFWNETTTPDDIRARLGEFQSKGLGAVYVHAMPDSFRKEDFHGGMEVEYLSDAFFELIRITCDELRRRGMIMWLYDEGGWPSGVAAGRVVAEDPNFGAWVLQRNPDGTVCPAQRLAELNYPDLMNRQATESFIHHTHERYRKFIGDEFGRAVRGIFTDEPRLLGRLGTNEIPYSPVLPEAFETQHGRPLNDVLRLLFEQQPDEAGRAAWRQYTQTYSHLIATNYFAPIRQWCERHHLLFEGHHSGENEFSKHGQYFGDYLQQARHYHIPGTDTIWRQIFPGQPGGSFVSLAASSAWLRGQRVAVSESFSVYGPGLTLEQMRWIAGYQIVRGVNKIGIMPSMQSTRGGRRVGLCTDFSPKTPIWRDLDLYTDFQRRAARFTLRGQPTATVGVYYRPELIPNAATAAEFDRRHEVICERIGDQFAPMLFVDLEALKAGGPPIDDLRILVVHAAELSSSEMGMFERLNKQGLPVMHVSTPDEVDVRAAAILTTDRPVRGVRLLVLRRAGATSGLMLFNQNNTPVEFRFRFCDGQQPALQEVALDQNRLSWISPILHSDDGYHVCLHAGECRALQPADTPSIHEELWQLDSNAVLNGVWSVREQEPFVIRDDIEIEMTQASEGTSPASLGDYATTDQYFSGSLLYRIVFTHSGNQGQRIVLDLGRVYHSAEVTLNDILVGRRAWPPYEFDVTNTILPGENELAIRITNTLANQWLRPDVHERDITSWNNAYLSRIRPFLNDGMHTGLIGPVRTRSYKR